MRIGNRIKVFFIAGLNILIAMIFTAASSVSATVPYIAERVNLDPSGNQTVGNTQSPPILSQDGRYVAFGTSSNQIVSGDTNGEPDVFVRDRNTGITVRANLSNSGSELSASYSDYGMSANGRFVVFSYSGTDAVSGDTNGVRDVFVRDLKNNTTEIVSLTSSGSLSNGNSSNGDITADGRYVVFSSAATNLVSGDTNSRSDIFIRDRKLGTTKMLSKSDTGTLSNNGASRPSISCDGSYVTFLSSSSNLVSGDTNSVTDIFLVDRIANDSITNVTISANAASGGSWYSDVSCNGSTIVFVSSASNLVTGDTNNAPDIFAYSMVETTFERVNLDSAGNQTVFSANPADSVHLINTNFIDFSGRYVVFEANTNTLVSGDTNGVSDVFLRDLVDGTTQIISKRNATTQTTAGSNPPAISADGRSVAFVSADTGLVSGDTNGLPDFFVAETGI